MFEWITGIYLIVAILLSASMVCFNKNSLKGLSPLKMLILFALSPALALRELISPYKKGKKR
ncbi:MAG: hypothetical protein ACMV1K_11545 [Sulfurospirillum sp.]